MDLVLSSGFLAFARHIGFLEGIEALGIETNAIVGTSSGAMVGALWAAGHSPDDIAAELSRAPPLVSLRPSWTPWRGLFSLEAARRRLASFLPDRFEDLSQPLAVGVQAEDGTHELIRSGDLPSAVMASCAMPYVFHAVHVDGRPLRDGGAIDRLGLDAWRAWRPDRSAIAHWVDRTAGRDVQADLRGVRLVKTPRSGAKLWSLGDFDAQRAEARRITAAALSSVGARRDARRPSA